MQNTGMNEGSEFDDKKFIDMVTSNINWVYFN